MSEQDSLEGGSITTLNALKNKLLGLTYNNLGCVAKQKLDYQEALDYLKKALVYESALEEVQLSKFKAAGSSVDESSDTHAEEKLVIEN